MRSVTLVCICVYVHQRGQLSSVTHRWLRLMCYFQCLSLTLTAAGQKFFEQLDLWPGCYLQVLGMAPSSTWISHFFLRFIFFINECVCCVVLIVAQGKSTDSSWGSWPSAMKPYSVKPEKLETKWTNLPWYVENSTSQSYHSNIKYNCMCSRDNERMTEMKRAWMSCQLYKGSFT